MRKTFINSLCSVAEIDERFCLIVGDLGFSVVEPFAERFPDRFLNVGVAEQNMIGVAAGWSLAEGKTVFVYSIGNFPTLRCLEQIRNDVCYHNADVKVVSVGGGLTYGIAGFTHFGTEDVAIMRALPRMAVYCPADAEQTRLAFNELVEKRGPGYIRIGKNNEPELHVRLVQNQRAPVAQLFRWRIDECDVVILALGTIAGEGVEAAEILRTEGAKVGCFGLPRLKPLDLTRLGHLLADKRLVVTLEEHCACGGLGTIISEALVKASAKALFLSLCLPDVLETLGKQDYLRQQYGLNAASVASNIRSILK